MNKEKLELIRRKIDRLDNSLLGIIKTLFGEENNE